MNDRYKVEVRQKGVKVLEFMVIDGKVSESILELYRRLRDEGCEVEIIEYSLTGLSHRRDS